MVQILQLPHFPAWSQSVLNPRNFQQERNHHSFSVISDTGDNLIFKTALNPKWAMRSQLLSTKEDSSFCIQPWHTQVILILYHFAFQHLHLAPTAELLLGRRPSWFLTVLYSSQIKIHIQDQPQKKKEWSHVKLGWYKKKQQQQKKQHKNQQWYSVYS